MSVFMQAADLADDFGHGNARTAYASDKGVVHINENNGRSVHQVDCFKRGGLMSKRSSEKPFHIFYRCFVQSSAAFVKTGLLILPYPFFPTLEQGGLQGGDDGAFENMFAAPEVVAFQSGQVAACFFENQRTGGVVPQFLPAVDVNVVASAGEVAPVECAAAHAADGAEWGERAHAAGEFAGAQVFDFDACDGFAEFFIDGAQGQWCAVKVCAFAAFGVEAFAADGVVDDAELGAAVFDEGDGNGEMGQSVDEVVGAVYGVDDPQPVGIRVQFPKGGLFLYAHFFAEHGAVDQQGQGGGEGGLGGKVGFAEHGAVFFAVRRGIQEARHDFGLRDVPDDFLQSV